MSDAGGQITHQGVLYQDKIAALYLGRMLDPRAVYLPDDQQVEEVSGEKPGAEVDDVYVRFADGHALYIQAKTALQDSGDTWNKLWEHFYLQQGREDFREDDRLVLLMGDYAGWYKDLKTITQKASSSTSLAEWQVRLASKAHKDLAKKLARLLNKISQTPVEGKDYTTPEEPGQEDYQRLKGLLRRVELQFIENDSIESTQLTSWMPGANVNLAALFSHLVKLVTEYSSEGRTFQKDGLRQQLDRLGVAIKALEQQSALRPALPDPDELPPAAQRDDLPPGFTLPLLRNDYFTGRESDLLELAHDLLFNPQWDAVITHGLGGTGKTQLAAEFCYRYGRFFQGVHWIQVNPQGDKPDEDIRQGIVACGEVMALQPWPDDLEGKRKRTIQAWAEDSPRLLVLDNLEDPAILLHWLGELRGCRVLVTARRGLWPKGKGLQPHPLGLLSPEESRELLDKLCPRLKDEDLDALAEQLGRLPLALVLAGYYLAERTDLTLDGYLNALKNSSVLEDPAFREWIDASEIDHSTDLAATFRLSWDALGGEPRENALARAAFRACGYLAPNWPIPIVALSGAVLAEEADPGPFYKALRRLYELGLLAESAEGAVIHPLLGEFARVLDGEAEESALPGLADGLASLCYAANMTGIPAKFSPLRAHVAAVGNHIGPSDQLKQAWLWNELGAHLDMTGDYPAARPYYERALAIRKEALGEKHPLTATSLNNLGYLLQAMGDYPAARDYLEQALAFRREAQGEKHPDIATNLNNLGLLLQAIGDYPAARPYYEQALAITREALGEKHPNTATGLNNLGYLLQDMGNYPAARPYYEQALAIRREALGEKHPDTAGSLNNLGMLLKDMGDYPAARPYLEQALAITREALGEKHPNTATSLNNLGLLLKDMGDYPAARPYYEQALAIKREALGEKHPSTGLSLNNLGALLHAMGDYPAARDYYEQALAIRREALGERHPDTATSLNNLGLLLQDMGDYPAARPYLEQALAILEATLPEGHPNIQIARDNLAAVERELKG